MEETTEPTETIETTGAATLQDEPDPGMAAGVLEGGWSYIWAAYILTWTFLGGYTIYVIVRKTLSGRGR